jgi:hypothetical protein
MTENTDAQVLDHQAVLLEQELRAHRARVSADSAAAAVAETRATLKTLGGKPLDLADVAGDLDDAVASQEAVRRRAGQLRGEARRAESAA